MTKWLQVFDWMLSVQKKAPKKWPQELPAESQSNTEDFWMTACKYEMSTRRALSDKILLLVNGEEPPMSPLEWWLFLRRLEWASQLVYAMTQQNVPPEPSVAEILQWALVESWQSDGCHGMWKHAERGGAPHPSNPDGLHTLL